MSSTAAHRIVNTRERATSTDINRIVQLSDRNTAIGLIYAAQQDVTVSGVFTGLSVSLSGETATVAPGFAVLNDGVASYPDSQYRWIEVQEGTSISINFNTERVNGEWMVVEIAPGTTDTITIPVDVFDPTTGAFVESTVTKEVQSAPVLQVRTSGNANQFPAGVTGQIPLAYIFDSGTGSFANADRVMCRPMLGSRAPITHSISQSQSGAQHLNDQWIQGGGIDVTADGTIVTAKHLTGIFWAHRNAFKVLVGRQYELSDANIWDGGVVASSETNVYLYAVQPPYPQGYGALPFREFFMGSNTIAQFATAHTGTLFYAQIGCIVVASTTPPDTVTGIQGNASADLVVHDTPWRDGAASVTVNQESTVYMGSIDWGTTEAKEQIFDISDARVVPQSRVPYNSISTGTTVLTPKAFNIRIGNDIVGTGVTNGDGLIPSFITAMRANLHITTSATGESFVSVQDDEANANIDFVTPRVEKKITVTSHAGSFEQNFITYPIFSKAGADVTGEWEGTGTAEVAVLSYSDPIIGAR